MPHDEQGTPKESLNVTLNRNKLQRENAELRAENAELKRKAETLDLQRLLLLDQIIDMQKALEGQGLQFIYRSNE